MPGNCWGTARSRCAACRAKSRSATLQSSASAHRRATRPTHCRPWTNGTDGVIRFQQRDFPVIELPRTPEGRPDQGTGARHVDELRYQLWCGAQCRGRRYRPAWLADDGEVYAYFDEVRRMPFLRGVQGEGRKWTATFSQKALGVFDYLFTDGHDHHRPQGTQFAHLPA